MANSAFLRKFAQDEMWDTLYFASGEVPIKEKSVDFVMLKTTPFMAKIFSPRKILVNDRKFGSIHHAKLFIQENL